MKTLKETIEVVGLKSAIVHTNELLNGSMMSKGLPLHDIADTLELVYDVSSDIILGQLDTVERKHLDSDGFMRKVAKGEFDNQ